KTLPINNCRTSKPGIPPRDPVETIDRIEHTAPMAQPQHACIVRSNVDGVSNSHTARKLELARSDGCPFAAWCTPAQRMSADNGERTAASIRCEPSDGLVRNLLRAPIAGEDRKSTRLNSSHGSISYAVFWLKKKKNLEEEEEERRRGVAPGAKGAAGIV